MNVTKTVFTFLFPLSEKEKNSLVKNTKTNNAKQAKNNISQAKTKCKTSFILNYAEYYRTYTNFCSRNKNADGLESLLNLLNENERLIKEVNDLFSVYDPEGERYHTILCVQKELIKRDIEEIKEILKKDQIFETVQENETMYEDKTLVCKDCESEFVFTANEQEFYAEKGFVNEPQRCKTCRDAKKAAVKATRELNETPSTCELSDKKQKKTILPKYATKELVENDIEKIEKLYRKHYAMIRYRNFKTLEYNSLANIQKRKKQEEIYRNLLKAVEKLENYKNKCQAVNDKNTHILRIKLKREYEALIQECKILIDEFHRLELEFYYNDKSDFENAGRLAADCQVYKEWLDTSLQELEKKNQQFKE